MESGRPSGLLADLGLFDLGVEAVDRRQDVVGGKLVGPEGLVTIDPQLPEVGILEQRRPPTHPDRRAAEHVGAVVRADAGRRQAPVIRAKAAIVALRSNPASPGAHATVAVPRRPLFQLLAPALEEIAAVSETN